PLPGQNRFFPRPAFHSAPRPPAVVAKPPRVLPAARSPVHWRLAPPSDSSDPTPRFSELSLHVGNPGVPASCSVPRSYGGKAPVFSRNSLFGLDAWSRGMTSKVPPRSPASKPRATQNPPRPLRHVPGDCPLYPPLVR